MSLNLIILEWSYKLQHEMDKMNADELNTYLKGKAIRYEGKLYTIGDENEQGKNSQVKSETSRTSKGSDNESKNV